MTHSLQESYTDDPRTPVHAMPDATRAIRGSEPWRLRVEELPHAEQLGLVLRTLRHEAGLTLSGVASRVGLAVSTVCHLELGQRRTRVSTLREFALVLGPATGRDPSRLLAVLVDVAGPALAAETARSEGSIARKRKRRRREALKSDIAAMRLAVGDDRPVEGGPEIRLRQRAMEAADVLRRAL